MAKYVHKDTGAVVEAEVFRGGAHPGSLKDFVGDAKGVEFQPDHLRLAGDKSSVEDGTLVNREDVIVKDEKGKLSGISADKFGAEYLSHAQNPDGAPKAKKHAEKHTKK